MARRYSRDNRGRFASGGGGATARGARLKTASGNSRTGAKMNVGTMSSVPKGTIAKGGAVSRSMAAVSGGKGTKVAKPAVKAKDLIGRAGKRIRNIPGNLSHSNNASIWTKRKATARGLRGIRPKGTINNPRKTNPSLKRRIAYK